MDPCGCVHSLRRLLGLMAVFFVSLFLFRTLILWLVCGFIVGFHIPLQHHAVIDYTWTFFKFSSPIWGDLSLKYVCACVCVCYIFGVMAEGAWDVPWLLPPWPICASPSLPLPINDWRTSASPSLWCAFFFPSRPTFPSVLRVLDQIILFISSHLYRCYCILRMSEVLTNWHLSLAIFAMLYLSLLEVLTWKFLSRGMIRDKAMKVYLKRVAISTPLSAGTFLVSSMSA